MTKYFFLCFFSLRKKKRGKSSVFHVILVNLSYVIRKS